MSVEISSKLLQIVHKHGEQAYPEEGAGFLLGENNGERKIIQAVLPVDNAREDGARHNRYLLTAQDYLHGEQEADRQNLSLIGVFHSHPDHPDRPSEFDRDWAMPWFSYLITSVAAGKAVSSRAWVLRENRELFNEEQILVIE